MNDASFSLFFRTLVIRVRVLILFGGKNQLRPFRRLRFVMFGCSTTGKLKYPVTFFFQGTI